MSATAEIVNAELGKVYSIILRDLSSSDGETANINPKCIWADHPQRENGVPKRGRQGELYTKTMVTSERYNDVTAKFKTPKEIIPNVNMDSCKKVITQLKSVLNKMPSGVWFHKAGDDACGKNAKYNHWHILVSPLGSSPFTDCSSWRSLVTATGVTQTPRCRNMDTCCTELDSAASMIYYLTIAPRQFIGTNNKQMLHLVKLMKRKREDTQEASDDFDTLKGTEPDNNGTSEEEVDDFMDLIGIKSVGEKRKLDNEDDPFGDITCDTLDLAMHQKPSSEQRKGSKRVKDTHYLETQLQETNTDNFIDLLKTADETERPRIKEVQASVHGRDALKTARTWISVEQKKTPLDVLLSMKEGKGKTLTEDDSYQLMREWEDHIGARAMSFWVKLYLILGCFLPKRNMLILEGCSNAGKTFFTEAWLKMTNLKIGEVVNDDRFMWANLTSADVGICNELMLDPTNIQVLKKLGEGQKCKVAVKGKDSQEVERTPLIMTTNHPVWKLALAEKRTILNRCFHYKITSPADEFLQDVKAPLHPKAIIETMKAIKALLDRNDCSPEELVNDQCINEFLDDAYDVDRDFLQRQFQRIVHESSSPQEVMNDEMVKQDQENLVAEELTMEAEHLNREMIWESTNEVSDSDADLLMDFYSTEINYVKEKISENNYVMRDLENMAAAQQKYDALRRRNLYDRNGKRIPLDVIVIKN